VTAAGLAAVREIAGDIKLSHSVFALPFALLGAFLALPAGRIDWGRMAVAAALVVACMVAARTAAMVANRLLDREIDARNPRTAGRALPAGRLRPRQAVAALALSGAAFVGLSALFLVLQSNPWPLLLAVPVLAWICAYGLLKRFTMMCHVWLGASLAMSPVAAALAVRPESLGAPVPWLLAAAVMLWVAGFDVLYAMQDVEVDVRDGLHSMPSRLRRDGAAWASRAMHAACIGLLAAFWRSEPALGPWFGAAVAVAGAVVAMEHVVLAVQGPAGFARHFTLLNGFVSLLLGGVGVAALVSSHG
jgi:4-hydroxybenzoate polyprenyltransferase